MRIVEIPLRGMPVDTVMKLGDGRVIYLADEES